MSGSKNLKSLPRQLYNETFSAEGILIARICKICGIDKSTGSSTSSLAEHLWRKHPSDYEDFLAKHGATNIQNPYTKRKEATQSTIGDSFKSKNNSEAMKIIAKCFAILSLPYHMIEKEAFIDMVEAYRNSTLKLPSARTLRDSQYTIAAEMKKNIISRINGNEVPVTVALDGWTNCRHSKVINILLFHDHVPFYWDTVENAFERNDGNIMYKYVYPILKNLMDKNVKIIAITMDNASPNKKLYKLLREEMPMLLNIPCAAHVLQLCVRRILKLPEILPIIKWMMDLLNTFRSDQASLLQLRRLQAAGDNEVKSLVRPVDTRWSSSVAAARRIYVLRNYINLIIPDIPEDNWKTLNMLVNFLEPFEKATTVIQTDNVTVYNLYKEYASLIRIVERYSITATIFNAAEIRNILIRYWKKYFNTNLVIITAILTFDESHTDFFDGTQIANAKTWFAEYAVKYLNQYYLTVDNPSRLIYQQFSSFQGCTNEFSNLKYIINKYKNENQDKDNFDAKCVWYFYLSIAKELCCVVLAILSLPISEAAVERSFSQQQIVHRKLRNRLTPANIQKEMLIYYNSKSFQQEKPRSHVSIEDLDKMPEDEDLDLFEFKGMNFEGEQKLPEENAMDEEDTTSEDEVDDIFKADYENINVKEQSIRCTAPIIILSSDSASSSSQNTIIPSKKIDDNLLNKATSTNSSNSTSTQKRKFVSVENVTAEYNEMQEFIKNYIISDNITSKTRWNEQQYANLQISLSKWQFQHKVKDALETIKTNIVKEIKKQTRLAKKQKNIKSSNTPDTEAIDLCNERRCCVCDALLDEDNWHTCTVCGAPMHGKIICNKGGMIKLDGNDNLICDKCCN